MICSSTLEILRDLLPAHVEEQAEGDWDVEVEPEHVRLDCSAEADSGLQVGEPIDESAAGLLWRCPHRDTEEAAQRVSADAQLQGVPWGKCLKGWGLALEGSMRWSGRRRGGPVRGTEWVLRCPLQPLLATELCSQTNPNLWGKRECWGVRLRDEESGRGRRGLIGLKEGSTRLVIRFNFRW